ncbi:hypothetical protein OURE66S_01243 [Oligella ureolytica]
MSQDPNKELKNALALSIGRKSVVVSLLLWFFLGALGVHRMYLGKVGSGIVMALLTIFGWMTMGVLIGFLFLFIVFIWWIFDLIVIIRLVKSHNQVYDQLKQ